MDDEKQYETLAVIRAYAARIAAESPDDIRPSTARTSYARRVTRMAELVKSLDTKS